MVGAKLFILSCTTCPLPQLCLCVLLCASCFMLPHYEWCWWLWSLLYLCFEGLLDDNTIVLEQTEFDFGFLSRICGYSASLFFFFLICIVFLLLFLLLLRVIHSRWHCMYGF